LIVHKFSQICIKKFLKFWGYQICPYFYLPLMDLGHFMIFYQTNVAKPIWDSCCHLTVQTGSWLPSFPFNSSATTFVYNCFTTFFNYLRPEHQTTFLCLNILSLDLINQFWTGLKNISFIKTQLYEIVRTSMVHFLFTWTCLFDKYEYIHSNASLWKQTRGQWLDASFFSFLTSTIEAWMGRRYKFFDSVPE
jgi:hypothetical protein